MKRLVSALALLVMLSGTTPAGEVVIPEDSTPFKIKEGDSIRIPVTAPPGTQVEARISRRALVTVQAVNTRVKGKEPAGPVRQEVEVKPKSKGKYTLYITVPTPAAQGPPQIYQFEVE